MGETIIDGVVITPLKIRTSPGGSVLHAMKNSDTGFSSFGEAYFSTCEQGAVKGWKRHREMTLNLVVPVGEMLFALYDDREDSTTANSWQRVVLSRNNYARLTVPPMIWVGFQGLAHQTSILLNIADIPHDPDEADRLAVDELQFEWSNKS